MADRIIVMHEGRVAGEIPDARQADQKQIMALAVR
jgi:ABC-type sugar transport system ATPase subunit